jgi:hypothetical protein
MKHFLVICIIFFLPILVAAESNENQKIDSHFVQSVRERGSTLYKQLLALKKNSRFLNQGFADPKSNDWYRRAQKLEKDCDVELMKLSVRDRVRSDLFSICVASNYLHQIGLRYAKHRGTDDDFSNSIKKDVEEAFNVK